MIWNFWCRCIYPLRCRFWDKDCMADASVILLSSKAEVCAQPISPFSSRLHGGLPAAPSGDNGSSGRVHGVDAVVHGPHLAPTLHRVTPKKWDRSAADERRSRRPRGTDRADLLRPERRRGTPDRKSGAPPPSRLPGSGGELRRHGWIGGIGAGKP